MVCKKSAISGSNVSHAQNHTKRKFRPNLQKVNGVVLCSKCIKTIKKINREEMAKIEEKKSAEVEKEKTKEAPKVEKEVKKPAKKVTKKAPAVKKTTAKK